MAGVVTFVACGLLIEKPYERRCLARCDSDLLALWKSTLQRVLDKRSEANDSIILDEIGKDEHSYLCRKCLYTYQKVNL